MRAARSAISARRCARQLAHRRSVPLQGGIVGDGCRGETGAVARSYRLGPGRRAVKDDDRISAPWGPAPQRTSYLMTTYGRSSGLERTTPVNLVEADGERWLISPYGDVGWVHNLRANGALLLRRGRATGVTCGRGGRPSGGRSDLETLRAPGSDYCTVLRCGAHRSGRGFRRSRPSSCVPIEIACMTLAADMAAGRCSRRQHNAPPERRQEPRSSRTGGTSVCRARTPSGHVCAVAIGTGNLCGNEMT
jgi:F420H(2)-dependent quinone reductase